MNTKRILSGILAAAMMLCLAGCGESESPESTKRPKKTKAEASVSASDSTPDSGEEVLYKLPAGAQSEYELYKTVVDFLNNGFHPDDLKDVYDPNLTLAFFSKLERDPEDIYTLGMQYDEACAFIARLREKASKMDLTTDEYGEIDEDLLDYDAFQSEFPESVQSQIIEEHGSFKEYFEDYVEYFIYDLYEDGKSPFGSDQTKWEAISKDALETFEFDEYDDYDKDLYTNFPRVYLMDLGEYLSGNSVYYTSVYYTKIDNSYYFVSFSEAVGATGG